MRSTSSAVIVPSALTPTLALNTSAWREFCRKLYSADGINRTGRPSLRESKSAAKCAVVGIFEPKPPPT